MTCPQQYASTGRTFSVAGRDYNRKWNGKAKTSTISSRIKSPTCGRKGFYSIFALFLYYSFTVKDTTQPVVPLVLMYKNNVVIRFLLLPLGKDVSRRKGRGHS